MNLELISTIAAVCSLLLTIFLERDRIREKVPKPRISGLKVSANAFSTTRTALIVVYKNSSAILSTSLKVLLVVLKTFLSVVFSCYIVFYSGMGILRLFRVDLFSGLETGLIIIFLIAGVALGATVIRKRSWIFVVIFSIVGLLTSLALTIY